MSKFSMQEFRHSHPRSAGVFAAIGALAFAAVVVLFAWNSFAVPVLELDTLRFKEALGLTLLLTVAGRLLAPPRWYALRHREPRSEP